MKKIKTIASVISWIAHPLFTSCVVVIAFCLVKYPFKEAMLIMGVLILGMIVPLNIFTYLKVKRGSYSDFDVSNRKQRYSLYPLVIMIMLVITFLLHYLNVDPNVVMNCFLTAILFMVVFAINFITKLSLHICLNTYFCFILYQISPVTALILIVILPFIAMSRIYLNRHSLGEVVTGGIVGLCFGTVLLMLNHKF